MRILAIFLITGSLFAQRILYNQDLDKKGQEAAAASKKIASQPVTSKELQNLSIVEKQEIEGALRDGYVTMRTQIQSFATWETVSRAVCKTLRQLYADDPLAAFLVNVDALDHAKFDQTCTRTALDAEKASHLQKIAGIAAKNTTPADRRFRNLADELKPSVVKLRATADQGAAPADNMKAPDKKAQDASAAPRVATKPVPLDKATKAFVDAAVERIGDVEQLIKLAEKVTESDSADKTKALDEIEKGIKEVGALVESAARIWASYIGITVDPRSLAPSREKLAVSLLAVDADRIKELASIRASNAMYLEDLRKRLDDCVVEIDQLNLWFSPESVETALTRAAPAAVAGATTAETTAVTTAARNSRVKAIYALHLAAAGAAVNQTPQAVQILRESIAERRYGLRRDAVYNGAYEVALQAAGQRLSAYYGAGVKPSQIAELLYFLSGIVSLPKIAF